jgi:hypothetical protein
MVEVNKYLKKSAISNDNEKDSDDEGNSSDPDLRKNHKAGKNPKSEDDDAVIIDPTRLARTNINDFVREEGCIL